MAEVKVTKANFEEEVLKSDIPVVVDFWATWCGPCRMLGPELEALAKEQEGKIKVCKINVDEEQDLAERFNVMSIPTLLIYKNGAQTAKQIGFCKKDEVLALVNQ